MRTTATEADGGALRGVNVLDLAASEAGSLAAALMADLGADVIKLAENDPRIGGGSVDPVWLVCNRGKKLAGSGGDDAVRTNGLVGELAHQADLVIAEDLSALRAHGVEAGVAEDVVVLLVPPYDGIATPWYGGNESAGLLNSITALAAYQASHSGEPIDSVLPYVRTIQAVWAATCGISALLERHRSHRGQVVTVSGLHAANVAGGQLYSRPRNEPNPDRAIGSGGSNPMYSRYRAGDGRWFFVGGLGPKFATAVVNATGSSHLFDDPRIDGKLARLWDARNSPWVIAYFVALYASRPAAYWIDLFEACDVPCTLLATRSEWFDSEQVRAVGQRVLVEDPLVGPVSMVGPAVSFDRTPARVSATSLIRPLESMSWTRARYEPPAEAAPVPSARSGPLDGYRVASFGSYVAGPYGARLLAELGADVIKVEPLQGDPWRLQGFFYNLGVRSLAVDLRHPDAIEAVLAVVDGCDVVMDNFRLGVTARLGIDHERLRERNPRALTVAVTAYGETGPDSGRPGYDTVLQAAAGMMFTQGNPEDPVIYSIPCNDHTAGALGALAAVSGLLCRERTGQGQHLSTSLAAAATLLLAEELTEYPNRPEPRYGGTDFRGPGPLDRLYSTADGSVRIQTATLDSTALKRVGIHLDERGLAEDPAEEIGQALGSLASADAVERLTQAGVPAVRARTISEVANDPDLHHGGFLTSITAPNGELFAVVNRMADFSRTPQLAEPLTPGLGEHTVEVLLQAGVAQTGIDGLISDGVVIDGDILELLFMPPYR